MYSFAISDFDKDILPNQPDLVRPDFYFATRYKYHPPLPEIYHDRQGHKQDH